MQGKVHLNVATLVLLASLAIAGRCNAQRVPDALILHLLTESSQVIGDTSEFGQSALAGIDSLRSSLAELDGEARLAAVRHIRGIIDAGGEDLDAAIPPLQLLEVCILAQLERYMSAEASLNDSGMYSPWKSEATYLRGPARHLAGCIAAHRIDGSLAPEFLSESLEAYKLSESTKFSLLRWYAALAAIEANLRLGEIASSSRMLDGLASTGLLALTQDDSFRNHFVVVGLRVELARMAFLRDPQLLGRLQLQAATSKGGEEEAILKIDHRLLSAEWERRCGQSVRARSLIDEADIAAKKHLTEVSPTAAAIDMEKVLQCVDTGDIESANSYLQSATARMSQESWSTYDSAQLASTAAIALARTSDHTGSAKAFEHARTLLAEGRAVSAVYNLACSEALINSDFGSTQRAKWLFDGAFDRTSRHLPKFSPVHYHLAIAYAYSLLQFREYDKCKVLLEQIASPPPEVTDNSLALIQQGEIECLTGLLLLRTGDLAGAERRMARCKSMIGKTDAVESPWKHVRIGLSLFECEMFLALGKNEQACDCAWAAVKMADLPSPSGGSSEVAKIGCMAHVYRAELASGNEATAAAVLKQIREGVSRNNMQDPFFGQLLTSDPAGQ